MKVAQAKAETERDFVRSSAKGKRDFKDDTHRFPKRKGNLKTLSDIVLFLHLRVDRI